MNERARNPESAVTCYALTVPGLETVAADEIAKSLSAEVKRTAPGMIVFKPKHADAALLQLRTVEDVFILLWGTDELSYRATDLDDITRWTAKQSHWSSLLQLHHSIRTKPKGKPTYRLVTQMQGEHGYRRVDAAKAFARGLAGKFPGSWKPADENAAVELWLTIDGASAVCGLRLSDRSMRHRDYKTAHLPASLRPAVAAAMIRLAGVGYQHTLLDPMCGVGTILAEGLRTRPDARVIGGDLDSLSLRASYANLRRMGQPLLANWDARRLPLADGSIHRLVCNPPFGKQMGDPDEIGPLYEDLTEEADRVLVADGRAVLLASDAHALEAAAKNVKWRRRQKVRLRILGQPAFILVFDKR